MHYFFLKPLKIPVSREFQERENKNKPDINREKESIKMKKVTKICVGVLTIMLVGVTALFLKVKADHSGETYYTCLVKPGEYIKEIAEDSSCKEYKYQTPGFNEEGEKLDLEFYSFRERALKTGAYLSIVYNKDNGVISYNEVAKKDIPEKALEGLKQYVD